MNIPRRTVAAILAELKRPLIVDEIELPEALLPGQVLVQVAYSGICGSQLGEIDGAKGEDRFLPHLLGHEGAGEVLAVGAGVTRVKISDSVVLHWKKAAGIDAAPPVYKWRGAKLNAGYVTTFNRHAVVSENRLTPIPRATDQKTAALFGCAVTTGFGIVENNARLRIGESVVVFGAGGIGLSIVQGARMVSCEPIIAVDRFPGKLALAKRLGATHVIDSTATDPYAEIVRITGTAGLDVFIDNTGAPEVIQRGYALTKPQGRVILVGVPPKGKDVTLYSLPLHFGKILTGSFGGEAIPDQDIPRYLRLVESGSLDLRPLITHSDTLANINSVIAKVRSGEVLGRAMIAMQ